MKFFKPHSIHVYLALVILLLLVGMVLDKIIYSSKSNYAVDTENFKHIFFQKEDRLNSFLDTLIQQTRNKSYKDLIKNRYPEFKGLLKEHGLAAFIYENDSLKFWSDNSIPVINKYSGSTFSNKIVFLQNAWYKVLHKTDSNRIIIGLILIKHKYQYENEFLKNEFHGDYNLPPSVTVSLDTTATKYEITDVNNNFLFTLIPSGEKLANNPLRYVAVLFYLSGISLLIFYLLKFFTLLTEKKKKTWPWLILLGVSIFILRYLMIEFRMPAVFYSFKLFDPQYYAQSFFFSSLGDFLINSVFIFLMAYLFYKAEFSTRFLYKSKIHAFTFLAVSLIIIEFLFVFKYNLFDSLIFNSSISFEVYRIFDLSIFSVIGFFIIAFLFAAFIIVADKVIMLLKNAVSLRQMLLCFIITTAVLSPVFYQTGTFISSIYPVIFLLIIISVLAFIRYKNYPYNYYLLLLIMLIASSYIVFFIISSTYEKEKNIRKVVVVNLANERDLVAELLLQEISPDLREDKTVKNFLHFPHSSHKELQNYIQKEYFKGFWNKYNLKIYVCSVRDSLFIEPDYKMSHCYTFFGDVIEKYGVLIPKTSFYFLDNVNGRINYLGVLKYKIYAYNLRVTLYVELASKLVTEELGYPELLLDKKLYKKSNISEYSYAKYRNNQLLSQIGPYRYNLTAEAYDPKSDEFNFVRFDGYSHLIYNIDKNNIIILSRPELRIIDVLISLSYIFVFFFILTNIILFGTNFPQGFRRYTFNLQARIQLSMTALLLLSMFLIGGGTVYYNLIQYNDKNHESIREKIQSVVKELENNLGGEFELTTRMRDQINSMLLRLSAVFYTDINLYDSRGNLLGTSRPEIFEKGLIGTKINIDAFRQLMIYKKAEYIHTENIGELYYLSAYVPLKNNNGRLLAYLNLPYFTKQTALTKELSSFVAAIVNIYVLLVLLSILITLFITNKLTQPLSLIQRKLREITLGKKNEQIEYGGKDEIGNLIKEYNRMVEELAYSATLLAKSERESAWREMAKQIAHEIKNPLTPMKLSVQYLHRVWKDKKPDKEEVMEKVTQTLIEQIDTLSAIATEFSNFAKMPKPSNEKIDIVEVINSSVHLFKSTENIAIDCNMHGNEQVFIFADREQMLRVFTNLLKNAVQAIPDDSNGFIEIHLTVRESVATIVVKDNGSGIPKKMIHKIFEPNFTTKTSGMGLGLSIVKNIVENLDGAIYFETEENIGTSFIIELPVYDQSEESE
ncbi:MAG: GHKL domain-containing protein [Bacteroidia bacterium]|nr:GHKL domain-containing protein [Bacteroidia bacterium]